MQEVLSMFQITDFQFFQHLPFAINCDEMGKPFWSVGLCLVSPSRREPRNCKIVFGSSDGESLRKHSLHGFGHE